VDKFAQLVSQSQVAIAILGNPALDTFEFCEITPGSMALTRCAGFVGVVGISGFKTQTVFAVELDDVTVCALARAVVGILERAIEVVERGVQGHVLTPREN
jgi:hypothetical protein